MIRNPSQQLATAAKPHGVNISMSNIDPSEHMGSGFIEPEANLSQFFEQQAKLYQEQKAKKQQEQAAFVKQRTIQEQQQVARQVSKSQPPAASNNKQDQARINQMKAQFQSKIKDLMKQIEKE